MTGERESEEPLVVVARATRTRGLKGELVADLLTDFPERFDAITRLICIDPNGNRSKADLEDHWFQQGRVILKLAGVDDIDSAARFVGFEFAVPESERVKLPTGQFYDWELEGCEVTTTSGRQLGRVREVMKAGGVDTLVVEADKERDYLVPLAEPIVIRIDLAGKAILIDPPEGLLEL